jgi:hypothetical protein
LNFHPLYNAALYTKALPEGRTSWIGEGLLAEEMPDFLVSNASLNANGNSPPWVRSSALSEPQLFIMSEDFRAKQKGSQCDGKNALCIFLQDYPSHRLKGDRVVKQPFAWFFPYQMTGRSSSGLYSLSPGLISGKAR